MPTPRPGSPHAVEAARDEIVGLSHRIHANPEPAFEEVQAATWVAEALRDHGFAVEHPAGAWRRPSARPRRGGRGLDGPRIGILAEYDALPGLGHGCGHNTMAASGVGAAIALAAIADEFAGEIVFFGTPAEEHGSGKADHDRGRPVRRGSTPRSCTTPATAPMSRAIRWPRRTSTSSSAGCRRTRRRIPGRARTRWTR